MAVGYDYVLCLNCDTVMSEDSVVIVEEDGIEYEVCPNCKGEDCFRSIQVWENTF